MNYDFSTLNDKDFELLVLDLLNAKFNFGLQSFKTGKDKGIDLRYSTQTQNNDIVVQAKHYIGSKFPQLKHALKEIELKKVIALNPRRYIVVTSLSLSANEKDELKAIFTPYLLSSNDVIGNEDLNSYLREFPEIEKTSFKLWFSSIHILRTILNNAIEGRTRYHLDEVASKMRYFVITKKLDEANKILKKEKALLITGQPGIGKTTLADILLFEWAKNDFKIYKVENIREAEDVISLDGKEKQLFYFDDFLGANYLEILTANKTETQLTSFINRVLRSPNKYLILTTRTVILNHAIQQYEKISHSKISAKQFEIKLNDYTRYEKALILYNHLFFKSIRDELYTMILDDHFYLDIVNHKNYTPRIIEFITDKSKIEGFTSVQYHQFILNNLNNPKEIWRYSFTNQIKYLDQCLLLTLFTFPFHVSEKILIRSFETRLAFERKEHNQIINSNQFNDSIKILLNGFLRSTIINEFSNTHEVTGFYRQFSFINPSLSDFLIGHCTDSFQERKSVISSILYVEQLSLFNPDKKIICLDRELQLIVRDKISNGEMLVFDVANGSAKPNKGYATILETLCRYCRQVNVDNILLDVFQKINLSENTFSIYDSIEYVLLHLGDSPLTKRYIADNFIEIVECILNGIDDEVGVNKIPLLFEEYGYDYDEYIDSENGIDNLKQLIERILLGNEKYLIRERKNEVLSLDDASKIYEEIELIEQELVETLFPNSNPNLNFGIKMDKAYWNYIIERNENGERNTLESKDDYYQPESFNEVSEDSMIKNLFSK